MTNSVDSEDTKIAMVSVFENIIKWLSWRPARSLFGRRSPSTISHESLWSGFKSPQSAYAAYVACCRLHSIWLTPFCDASAQGDGQIVKSSSACGHYRGSGVNPDPSKVSTESFERGIHFGRNEEPNFHCYGGKSGTEYGVHTSYALHGLHGLGLD